MMIREVILIKKIFFTLLVLILVTGCSAFRSRNISGGQFDVAVQNSSRVTMDPEIARSSQALHSYLVGELSYGREDFAEALKNFSKVSDLLGEPEPVVHTKLAELYLRGGDLEKALRESKKVLDATPDDKAAMLLYAGILESLGKLDEAEPVYRAAIEKNPESIEPYIFLSSLYFRRNEKTKSDEILKKLGSQHLKDPVATYYLGRAYEERGELATAEKYLERAAEAAPERVGYAVDLVRVLLKLRKIEKAKTISKQILARDGDNVVARKVLGQLLMGENNFDEALKHLQVVEATEKDPSDTRFKIALIQIEKRDIKEAIRELSLVLAQNPAHDEARYYLASLYAGLGQRTEALEELAKIEPEMKMYVKAKTLSAFIMRQDGNLKGAAAAVSDALVKEPTSRALLDYYVVILRGAKRFKDAEAILLDGLKRSPQDEKLLYSYAAVLNDLGRPEEAEQMMERILQNNPTNHEALNFVAYSIAERDGDLKLATEYVTRALKLRPENGYYLDTLGWIYFKAGEYTKAVEVLARSVAIVRDDMVLFEHYGDALVRTGDIKSAVDIYRKAILREEPPGGFAEDSEQGASRKRMEEKVARLVSENRELFPLEK